MATTHRYASSLSWTGSTADGYDDYNRTHAVELRPACEQLTLSSDPAFQGDGRLVNPEQLLLASVSSCQLLSFLAIAARKRLDVRAYADEAVAVMPEDDPPMRITRITLRPRILVAADTDLELVRRAVNTAHEHCFVANTLNAEMIIEPTLEHAG